MVVALFENFPFSVSIHPLFFPFSCSFFQVKFILYQEKSPQSIVQISYKNATSTQNLIPTSDPFTK